MTFTIVFTEDIGMVRLLIGDVTEGNGPFPDDRNFTDEEIQALLTRNNSDINAAAAECLEILSRSWAGLADLTLGPIKENYSQVSKAYVTQAMHLRETNAISGISFSTPFVRVDGYSEDNDA